MSDFGADKNADLNIATNLAHDKSLLPDASANVMQWTYPDGVIVQKLASRKDHSNLLIKLQEPI